jgi:hypothetical protein
VTNTNSAKSKQNNAIHGWELQTNKLENELDVALSQFKAARACISMSKWWTIGRPDSQSRKRTENNKRRKT